MTISAVAAVAVSVASAATLKWQINTECVSDWTSAGLHRSTYDKDNNKFVYGSQLGDLTASKNQTEREIDFSGSESSWFYMNIYNSQGEAANSVYTMGGKGYVTYDQIRDAINSAGKYEFKDYNTGTLMATLSIAPEPTSGLLLLVGCAALALRRRRAAALAG
ncbi:MAG TPA: hypothetical protein DD637_04020 [Verrucomicrobia bacterium]|nr:hypothetical protein [Verrucomicrobiota bacterium]HCG20459.1 hypothetical protein [Verrucomicrobiota bacterium]